MVAYVVYIYTDKSIPKDIQMGGHICPVSMFIHRRCAYYMSKIINIPNEVKLVP